MITLETANKLILALRPICLSHPTRDVSTSFAGVNDETLRTLGVSETDLNAHAWYSGKTVNYDGEHLYEVHVPELLEYAKMRWQQYEQVRRSNLGGQIVS